MHVRSYLSKYMYVHLYYIYVLLLTHSTIILSICKAVGNSHESLSILFRYDYGLLTFLLPTICSYTHIYIGWLRLVAMPLCIVNLHYIINVILQFICT